MEEMRLGPWENMDNASMAFKRLIRDGGAVRKSSWVDPEHLLRNSSRKIVWSTFGSFTDGNPVTTEILFEQVAMSGSWQWAPELPQEKHKLTFLEAMELVRKHGGGEIYDGHWYDPGSYLMTAEGAAKAAESEETKWSWRPAPE